MARILRGLLLLTLVLGVAAVVVSADAAWWMPSFMTKSNEDKAKDVTAVPVDRAKSWTNWAANYVPYFSDSAAKQTNEKLDGSKDIAASVTGEVAGNSQEKSKTAADTAREYAAKGFERVTSTKDQLHGATKGFIQRWGSWVKDNAGKYYSYGPLSQKASEKTTDVVDKVDSAADSTNTQEYVDSAKEEVLGKTDEKEL